LLWGNKKQGIILGVCVLCIAFMLGGYLFFYKKLDSQLAVVYQTSENLGWEDYLLSMKTESQQIDKYFVEDVVSELEDSAEILTESNLLSLSADSGLIFMDIKIEAFEGVDDKPKNKNIQALAELRFGIQQYCEMLIVMTPFSSSGWAEANKRGDFISHWLQEEENFTCPMIIKPLPQGKAEIKGEFRLALLVKDENA
jgi:hypothetical protein